MHFLLAAELPIRLAHRVKELDELPHNLNKMPSIEKVKRWYAESFEVSDAVSLSYAPEGSSAGSVLAGIGEFRKT